MNNEYERELAALRKRFEREAKRYPNRTLSLLKQEIEAVKRIKRKHFHIKYTKGRK